MGLSDSLGPTTFQTDLRRNSRPRVSERGCSGHEASDAFGEVTARSRSSTGFTINTANSARRDTRQAVQEIFSTLCPDGRGSAPDLLLLAYGADRPVEDLHNCAREVFAGAQLHGSSSCLGVLTHQGALIDTGDSVGALAIWDSGGAYGTGWSRFLSNPRQAAAAATRTALENAGRVGEAPELVWLTSAPGHEEAVLDGIRDVVGHATLIVGASSADNDVTGNWSQFDKDGTATDSVVVSVLFPTVRLTSRFDSGYASTQYGGRATAAEGRKLGFIDDRPAASVYAEWVGGAPFEIPSSGQDSVLSKTAMAPLGRVIATHDDVPFYLLAHPALVQPDGSIEFFCTIENGDELRLMNGAPDTLVRVTGDLAKTCIDDLESPAAGALVVFCGGTMMAMRESMNEVCRQITNALGDAPFLGVLSFGEQGEMLDGTAGHGNLMISCTTFGNARLWGMDP